MFLFDHIMVASKVVVIFAACRAGGFRSWVPRDDAGARQVTASRRDALRPALVLHPVSSTWHQLMVVKCGDGSTLER